MDFSLCKKCKTKTVIFDSCSNAWVCSSCALVLELEDYRSHLDAGHNEGSGNVIYSGPVRTYIGKKHNEKVYIPCSSDYRERKIYLAQEQIDRMTRGFGFPPRRLTEIKKLIEEITEGEYGQGNWFQTLIAAVSYVVLRRDNLPTSIAEVSSVVGCELYEVGQMIARVTKYINISLPEFDFLASFEKVVRSQSGLAEVDNEKIDIIIKQGRFLLTCCEKWFLTTGRQPLPMIAAVLTFVAEGNQLKLPIKEVAKEAHAGLHTSNKRYMELKEMLVKESKALPWGKDITVKNVALIAQSLFAFLEKKSKLSPSLEPQSAPIPVNSGCDVKEVLYDCLKGEVHYLKDCLTHVDVNYRPRNHEDYVSNNKINDISKLKLSEECLCRVYQDFLKENNLCELPPAGRTSIVRMKRKRRGDTNLKYQDWWGKMSKCSRNNCEEDDLSCDALPPSFMKGREACERRKTKISSAKKRIDNVIKPKVPLMEGNSELSLQENFRRRTTQSLDWEDSIIELLLLHQVSEEEIELGYYNTLLDLHVFNAYEHRRRKTRVKTVPASEHPCLRELKSMGKVRVTWPDDPLSQWTAGVKISSNVQKQPSSKLLQPVSPLSRLGRSHKRLLSACSDVTTGVANVTNEPYKGRDIVAYDDLL